MASEAFQLLLEEARKVHARYPVLHEFCPFPTDLEPLDTEPMHLPCADRVYAETDLECTELAGFRDAFIKAGPDAFWRETYKETNIGQDFLDRFACYGLISESGGWISKQMLGFFVYMPPGLYYPWHHHPAEELYFVIAGEGEFMRDGEAPMILREGDACFHKSNQPHALETHDMPIMAYVLWRNHFDVKPVLTEREVNP